MASERVSSPTPFQVAQDALPRHDVHPEPASAPEPAPPSQEGDPFRSREGSPRQTAGNIQPSSTNPQTHAPGEERFADGDSLTGVQDRSNTNQAFGASLPFPPSPVRYPSEARPGVRRQLTMDTRMSHHPRSFMDHLVPTIEKKAATIGERLAPTLEQARNRRNDFAFKAKWTGYALNAAIGMQVLLGSLTTGLSAAATSGKSAAVQTTILGGLSTIVASYLARSRGTNEPELSTARVKDLEQFIRETEAFILDHGHVSSDAKLDDDVTKIRERFELLLGNTTKGEVKLSQASAA